jgi:tRNA A37 methylthiotransferase MiaB
MVASELAKRLSAKQNKRWVGWNGSMLVDEAGTIEGSWVGRNFAYKPIVVQSSECLLGKTLQVKVVEALGTYLKGALIDT